MIEGLDQVAPRRHLSESFFLSPRTCRLCRALPRRRKSREHARGSSHARARACRADPPCPKAIDVKSAALSTCQARSNRSASSVTRLSGSCRSSSTTRQSPAPRKPRVASRSMRRSRPARRHQNKLIAYEHEKVGSVSGRAQTMPPRAICRSRTLPCAGPRSRPTPRRAHQRSASAGEGRRNRAQASQVARPKDGLPLEMRAMDRAGRARQAVPFRSGECKGEAVSAGFTKAFARSIRGAAHPARRRAAHPAPILGRRAARTPRQGVPSTC